MLLLHDILATNIKIIRLSLQALPTRLEEDLKDVQLDYFCDNLLVLTPAGVPLKEPVGVLPCLEDKLAHN